MGQTTQSGLNNPNRFVSARYQPGWAATAEGLRDGRRADGKLAVAKTDWEADEGTAGNCNYCCCEVDSAKLQRNMVNCEGGAALMWRQLAVGEGPNEQSRLDRDRVITLLGSIDFPSDEGGA